MARKINRLSVKAVESQKVPGYYPDGAGLYLQVSPSLSKSWIFRYALNGRERQMGLGSLLTTTLAEARKSAGRQRALLQDGIDPIAARNAKSAQDANSKAKNVSFESCGRAYIEVHSSSWKNAKHAAQWASTLQTYVYPIAGTRAVQDVDTDVLLDILKPIWLSKPETASRVRGRIESILSWASARGYRSGENPARWRGHLDQLLPPISKSSRVKHHAALPYDQIASFMVELRKQEGVAARALEFTILTAARTGEVIGATPTEFDMEKGAWTIPAVRTKTKREHRIPLPFRAFDLVWTFAEAGGPYIFPGHKQDQPLSNMAMLKVLERMGRADLTVHGFRSTFRDWGAEQTSYPNEVLEMALGHAVGDKVEAAYRRGDLFDKRRRLAQDWARYCDGMQIT